MNISKEQLKQIIKEELEAVLSEEELDEGFFSKIFGGGEQEKPPKSEPFRAKQKDLKRSGVAAVAQSSIDNAEQIAAQYEKAGMKEKADKVRKAIEMAKAGKVGPDEFHNLFEERGTNE